MKISYAGDQILASHFTQMAQQEFYILKSRPSAQGQFVKVFRNAWGQATVTFTIGKHMDGVHIVAQPLWAALTDGQAPSFFSGAVINSGVLANGFMFSYAPTNACIEQYGYTAHPVRSKALAVKSHPSMPTRMSGGLYDSQYTTQQSSKYTGLMCKLVQVILGYGKLTPDSSFASAIKAFKDDQGAALVLGKSVLITPGNANGVQNTFGYEWARTTGVYAYYDTLTQKTTYWLINISVAFGVQAMPLQIEPITATPQFRAFIVAEAGKSGAKAYLDDILTIIDTFGGFPSNEAFLTTVKSIKDQIVTILDPSAMGKYITGRPVSEDHGWAFNDSGTCANTICLEERGEGSWYMAHHCQVSISYDSALGRPAAAFAVIESGAAPVGKHYLKVGSTALDACVSYNMSLRDIGDYSDRPPATRTAMFVFWKFDRLEALRWTDGKIDPSTSKVETSNTRVGDFLTTHYLHEVWNGASGMAQGFFCTLHDGRIPTTDYHYKQESWTHLENERYRGISWNPASDTPEWYSRSFWTWTETRTETTVGDRTDDCCAFIPLGDRSAFYIATMTTKGSYADKREVDIGSVGDPYVYGIHDTYIWNWDFGTRIGEKYPLLENYVNEDGSIEKRVFSDGIVTVVWDRGGAKGKFQLDHYGQYYITGPSLYKGGWGYFALTQTAQDRLNAWTDFSGQGEWMSSGAEPTSYTDLWKPFTGNPTSEYNRVTSNGGTTLSVYLISMQEVSEVFRVNGPYAAIYRDYNYWFDRSPNPDGDFQTMWAFKNYLGGQFYQLYSTDVNKRELAVNGGYALEPSDFPTFIGVVGEIPA